MDDETRAAQEMTTDELLARAARGVPLEGTRGKPKTRNREDFAQRMHRVVSETIERSERDEHEPRVVILKHHFVEVSRATLASELLETTEPESDRRVSTEFRTVPVR
jgi:hypothetical protein